MKQLYGEPVAEASELQRKVEDALQVLMRAGAKYGGLIPSILDRHTGEMLREIPDPIPGQRQHDRSPRGSNLMHDVDLLALMYDLTEYSSRKEYSLAADRYLRRFAQHCTNTPTGLFPWGEHAYWDLDTDALGNSQAFANRTISRGAYHDHLREAPVWLWEKLYEFNPQCVERFADGLKHHWKSGKLAHEYFRHAYIERPEIPLPHEATSRDFARHGAFYLLDWAFAYCRFGRSDFEQQMRRMNDYWWQHHHPSGLLPQNSRDDTGDADENFLSLGQTLSYAATTLDAAGLLEQDGVLPDLAASLRERALLYAEGCVSAPHRPQENIFYHAFDQQTLEGMRKLVAWGSTYSMLAHVPSEATVSSQAIFMLRIYRHLKDQRLLDWAEAAARFVLSTPFPADAIIQARDAGEALGLLLDLYDTTGEAQWLRAAQATAKQLVEIYFESTLPRGASSIDWYEAQLGAGLLLRSLGRCAIELQQIN